MTDRHGSSGPAEGEASPPTLLERAGSAAARISSAGPQQPRARAALQWGIAALIFGFLIFFMVRQAGELPDFDWRFEPGWLALSVPCLIFFYALQGELWLWIVGALGANIEPVPARAIWGKSLLARYVPTNALMVVGRIVMAERLGVSKRVTLASIVYELGMVVGTAVMVGAYFVINLPGLSDQPARFGILALIPIILAFLHPRVFRPLVDFALRKLGREPLRTTLSFGRVLGLAALYLVAWAAIGLGLFAFASAVHPFDLADLPYVAASYPVAFCVAVLTFIVPSGLGTRDAALATAIAAVAPATVATAVAVAFRILQTGAELLYVGAVVGFAKRRAGG